LANVNGHKMIKLNRDNWWSWWFDNEQYADRANMQQKFNIRYSAEIDNLLPWREEMIRAARLTREDFPGEKLTLLLSGGSESEQMLRAFILANVDIDVVIVRYEQNINAEEVWYATELCKNLQHDYKILDFNLIKFLENDIDPILDVTQIERPRMLPQVAFADLVDGIPMTGSGDQHWLRPHKDYTKSATWLLQEFEHELGWDRWFMKKNRQALMHWLRYTPEMFLSYTRLKWFQDLTHDKIPGKLGNWSTKLIGYTEAWPEITQREKLHGFEKCEELINEIQDYIHKRNGAMSYFGDYKISIADLNKQVFKYF